MTEKEMYTSPDVKVFEVRIGGILCQSTGEKFNDPENWPGVGDWNIM